MSTEKKQKQTSEEGSVNSLNELFLGELKDIYWVENALIKALPEMMNNATDTKLKTALKNHLAQTQQQVVRLEEIFKSLGEKAEGEKCLAMEGIIKEGQKMMAETATGPVRDAAIISSGQKVEHYEIAAYGTLAAFAKTLNERPGLDLILKTLGEEKKSDCLLSTIADTNLNSQAVQNKHQSKDLNAV